MVSRHSEFVDYVINDLINDGYKIIDTEFIVEGLVINGSRVKIDILVEKDNVLIPVECGHLAVPKMERRSLLIQKYGKLLNIPYGNFRDKRNEYVRFRAVDMVCTRKDCPKSISGWNYTGKKMYPGCTPCPLCKKQIRIPKVV